MEQLKMILVEEKEDGTQIHRLPNQKEMMEKINEIIHMINGMNSSVSRLRTKSFVDNLTKGW